MPPAPLVWLHAFPLGADMWQPQLQSVPDGCRVVAPDLAGFGGTADHNGRPSIDDFAHDLDDFAHNLGLRHFVLGGLSMGGYAVFAYLRLNPSRLKGIVLADTKSGADTSQARDGRQKMLDLVASKGVAGVADEMVPKLLGATTQRANPALVVKVRAMIEANSAEGVSRSIQRLRDRPDATPQLARAAIPALVIVGEEDGITPVAEARTHGQCTARGDPRGAATCRTSVQPRGARRVPGGPVALADRRCDARRGISSNHNHEDAKARWRDASSNVAGRAGSVLNELCAFAPSRLSRGSWMNLELTDKVALITGSSRGLGLASAVALAAEGCRVMLYGAWRRATRSRCRRSAARGVRSAMRWRRWPRTCPHPTGLPAR